MVVVDSEEAAAVAWVGAAELDSPAVVAHVPPGDSVAAAEEVVVVDSREELDLRSEVLHR